MYFCELCNVYSTINFLESVVPFDWIDFTQYIPGVSELKSRIRSLAVSYTHLYHYGTDKDAKDLAYNLQATFEGKYEQFQKGRGYKGYVDNRGLYMLRKVDPTAVYIELANIRNKSDHIRLMESANRQALANWLFEGLTGIQ